MTDSVIQFDGVDKSFKKRKALDDLSFSLRRGEVMGFIGPNGSGKTTTIRLILGYYRANRGSVRVFGQDPRKAYGRVGRRIGVMLDQPGLHARLSGLDYLRFYAGLFGIPAKDAVPRCRGLLEMVGLADRADDQLGAYSKGMQQRIALARSLVNRPELVILDEPFDGVDAETRRDMLELIPRMVADEGVSVFVTSHNLKEVEAVSDRVAVIKQGRLLALDRTAVLRDQVKRGRSVVIRFAEPVDADMITSLVPWGSFDADSEELRFTPVAGLGVNELLRVLIDQGITIRSLHDEGSSLEDIYFALTGAGEEAETCY